jgi:hypothetical protein
MYSGTHVVDILFVSCRLACRRTRNDGLFALVLEWRWELADIIGQKE